MKPTKMKMKPQLVIVFVLLFIITALTFAQDAEQRNLTPDTAVQGAISAETPAQIYNFVAQTSGAIELLATTDSGMALTLVVSNASGVQIAQASDASQSGSVALNTMISEPGLHYVTVFPAPTSAVTEGAFSLILSVSAGDAGSDTGDTDASTDTSPEPTAIPTDAPATETDDPTSGFNPGQILTTTGLQVSLTWDSTADLNLQVRDPVGETLFFDSTSTNNGGTFGFDVNGLCETQFLTADNPTETAEWSSGAIPTGSYEILVFYRQDCEGTGAANFTINTTVDGQQLPPVEGTLTPPINGNATVYLSSFKIAPDSSISQRASGLYQDTRTLPAPASELLAAPSTPISTNEPITGLITSEEWYDLYQFTGNAGDAVAITMTALDGNLDTLLLVFDQSGQIIADNDDVVNGDVTDSAINNPALRVPADGAFTIMAARYGKDVGGTEGNYELLVSGSEALELPEEVVNLDLPRGDIEVLLTWNTNADLQLLVRDPAGLSVYDDEQQIASGGRIVEFGNINCTVSESAPISYTYWPFGLARGGTYEVEVWYQNECGDTRDVDFTLYVTVGGQTIFSQPVFIQPNQRFVTSFTIDANNVATMGNAGIIGGSETLAGQYTEADVEAAPQMVSGQTLRGNITPDNSFDLYTFEGQAGQTVTISSRRTQGSLDTKLFLLSPSGFEVAENDDAVPGETTDALISNFVLPETGRYVIVATHFGTIYGGTTGSYELTLLVE